MRRVRALVPAAVAVLVGVTGLVGAPVAGAAGLVDPAGAVQPRVAPVAAVAGAVVTAEVVQVSVWNTGYTADVRVANRGDAATTGWTVEFDLPTGTTIANSWSSVRTSVGQHHRFANASWNAVIPAGGSTTFGFTAAGTGVPTACLVNGLPCAGGPAPTTTPPATTAPPTTPPATTPPPATTAPATTAPPTTPPPTGEVVPVANAAQLAAALAAARPGQTISLAPGTYEGAFLAQTAGTAAAPITLTGPRTAVLSNLAPAGSGPSCPVPTQGWDPGYGLWLYQAPHWRLRGFTVADAKKGIVLDDSRHVTIEDVHVHHIAEEGVHFRRSSADGLIRNSVIEYTGLVQPAYGEGVYLGSANSNWGCHGNSGGVDRSDRVRVLDNRIGPYVSAEHIDVKEGTVDGEIAGNTFDGRGIAGQNSADSWVDVKGSGYLIRGNTGTFAPPGTFANGYETHNPLAGTGCGNVWRDNVSDLGGVGQYAIRITSTSKCAGNLNVVHASNTVSNAVQGLTNVAVTP